MVKYIIRLDDACPTMNWINWNKIFKILDKNNIKPIVAVIPNNEDHNLKIDSPRKDFWNIVKKWELKGYHIAMHGYNHVYISHHKGIIPINDRSEFAGVRKEEQLKKIKLSWKILNENKIVPKIWAAPAHTFDKNTLEALKTETNIQIISDGISTMPFSKYGFFWLPQQLWKPQKKRRGIWTICLHPNNMTKNFFNSIELFFNLNKEKFTLDISSILYEFNRKPKSLFDHLFAFYFFSILKIKKTILN